MTMNLPPRESTPVDVKYFREYGLHDTGLRDPTYIASAPSWGEMEQLLKFRMPYGGDIVTNDYATMSEELWADVPGNMNEINDRIRAVRAMSMRVDATIHLGTPFRGPGGIHTSAVSIHRGDIVGKTYKNVLYDVERDAGLSDAPWGKNEHVRENGTALAICSDLVAAPYFFTAEERRRAKRLFGLTAWAFTESGDEKWFQQVTEAGGFDKFFQQRLEFTVGTTILPELPNVRSVVISDEGQPSIDLAPFNAVFTRK
ncbi:MAG: hypothetical protein JWO07_209 [Candidatus Saccharibacteria bacterium]|nr:hypothetical protein [Candidatus Saccharibacteria bacterium]